MNPYMKKPLIVANWKCNPTTLAEAKRLLNSVKKGAKNIKNVEVVICPPFVYLATSNKQQATGIKLGAQDCFWEESGAFTGEVSPKMLRNLGLKYVIIGHSERRKNFKETDEIINKKIKAALKNNLQPILCIEKISQIKKALKGISKEKIKKIIVAYEPVWAIGTGRACGIPRARRVNLSIRKILGKKISVLYGGSVSSQNAADFIKGAKFQGLLIGGASLDAKEFIKILKAVSRA